MKKVIFSLAVIAFASKVDAQMQLPVIHFDMNEFMANQQHPQMMHHLMDPMGREHHHHMNMQEHEAEEPVVGSPLLGFGLAKPFGLGGILHPLGIPGLRFSNFQAGHLGNLKFGNAMLGAGNPMEAEGDSQLGGKHHHHHIDSNHEMEHQLAAMPPQHYQAEPQLAAAQQPQEFGHFWHFANPEMEHQLAAMAPQHYQAEPQIAAPQQPQEFGHFMPFSNHEVGAEQPFPPGFPMSQHFQVAAPQMQQFEMQPVGPPMPPQMEMQPFQVDPNQMHSEAGARHWWGKGQDDYGYG